MFSQLSLFLLSLAFLLQQRMTFRRSKKASQNFARVVRQAEASSVSVHRDVTTFPMFLPLIVGWEFSTKNKKNTCCLRVACCAQETELMVMAGSVPKVLAIRCNQCSKVYQGVHNSPEVCHSYARSKKILISMLRMSQVLVSTP